MLGVVEMGQIVDVIWVSILAGVGITVSYSFVVVGWGRSAEARRAHRTVAMVVYGALAVVSLAVFATGIVLGVQIMLTKS